MKAHGRLDVQIHTVFTLAVVGGEWSASRLGRFTIRENLPVPTGQEVGWTPEQALMTGEEKILDSAGTQTDPTASLYTNCANNLSIDHTKTSFPRILMLLHAYSLLQEHVY
jgi:hypothetical protein